MGESSENNIPNDSDSNEIIEIKHDDLEELEQQIIFSSLNEWEVGMEKITDKFFKDKLLVSSKQKETKNKHKVLVLDKCLLLRSIYKIVFGGEYTSYTLELNKGVNEKKTRKF
ncbi:6613_t:CDS:2 [Rhizophagus irregularis]|nr:6613_t:CDS:2 [Rhizophagus irregularis]